MECAVCQMPVPEGAEECAHCGASAQPDEERTAVGRGQAMDTTGGPPRGEVLGERWEIRTRLESSPVTTRYRALDQESEQEVLVTLVAPDVVPTERDREALRERFSAAVGTGNKFVPGLVAADREGRFVWAVEPDATGTTLRDVLDARRARGETMLPAEVLPVVAQIATGLASIPPPLRHGDVRAERVRIHGEGLALMGAFLLPALPSAAVAKAIASDAAWARAVAPEMLRGAAGDGADRFAVALLAFEALSGAPWTPGGRLPAQLGGVDDALRALLATDPNLRPTSLDPLVQALARAAALPVPAYEPAAFRRVRKQSVRPPPTAAALRPASVPPPAPVPPPASVPAPGTDPEGERVGPKTDPEGSQVGPKTDPVGEMVGPKTEPGVLLVPDGLPPAYRLDDAQTMPESAKLTRRVVAYRDDEAAPAPERVTTSSPRPSPARTPSTPPPRAGEARTPSTPPPRAGEARTPSTPPPRAGEARTPSTPPRAGEARTPSTPPRAGEARTPSTPPRAPSRPPPVAEASRAPSSRPPPKADTSRPAPSADTTQPNAALTDADLGGEPTHMNASVAPTKPPSRSRAIAGAARDGTQEIAMGDLQSVTARDSKEVRVAASDIDPRLLRAALEADEADDALVSEDSAPKKLTGDTQQLAMSDLEVIAQKGVAKAKAQVASGAPAKKKRGDDTLDPRLVRAALGVQKDDTIPPEKKRPETQELRLDEVEVVKPRARTATPAAAPPAAAAPRPRTATPAAARPAPSPAPAAAPASAARGGPSPARPTDPTRASAPARASAPPSRASAPPSRASGAPPRREATPAIVMPLSPGLPNEPARVAPPPAQRPPNVALDDSAAHPVSRRRGGEGVVVIWVSVAIAVLIVSVGGFIAWRRHASAEADRERVLQQRFEQLRHPQ